MLDLICRCAAVCHSSGGNRIRNPLVHGMLRSTVQATCLRVLGSAIRTNRPGLERVKPLCTLLAIPIGSYRRRRPATRTCESITPWQPRNTYERPRLLEPAPAIHQHEDCNRNQPDGAHP